MTNDIVKDLKRQYEKEFASIFDLQGSYPSLTRQEILFLLQESGVKVGGKGTTTHRKKLRNRWLADKNKPTAKQLETLHKQYGDIVKVWIMVYKDQNIRLDIVQDWFKELGLGTKRQVRFLTKEERMRRILAKVS